MYAWTYIAYDPICVDGIMHTHSSGELIIKKPTFVTSNLNGGFAAKTHANSRKDTVR